MQQEETFFSLRLHWEELLREGRKLFFRKGQTLFYEGHIPYGLFVLKSGQVDFTGSCLSCTEEHGWASPNGEVLGMQTFLKKLPYCCTCTAKQDCQTIFISKTQLFPYLSKELSI